MYGLILKMMMRIISSASRNLIWLGLACQVTPISTFKLFHGLLVIERKMMSGRKRSSNPGAVSTQTYRTLEALRRNLAGLFQQLLPSPEIHSRVQTEINSLACRCLTLLLLSLSSSHLPSILPKRALEVYLDHMMFKIGLMASKFSLFLHLWRRILNLSRMCPQACHSVPCQCPVWAPGCSALFAFPQEKVAVLTLCHMQQVNHGGHVTEKQRHCLDKRMK